MSLVSNITAAFQAVATDIKNLTLNKVNTEVGKGLSPLTKEFVSPETVVTAANYASFNHGLGVMPKVVTLSLICKTGEQGFSAGEEAILAGNVITYLPSGNSFGVQVASNSTTTRVKIGSTGLGLLNLTTGVAVQINPSNWRLIIRAYA